MLMELWHKYVRFWNSESTLFDRLVGIVYTQCCLLFQLVCLYSITALQDFWGIDLWC